MARRSDPRAATGKVKLDDDGLRAPSSTGRWCTSRCAPSRPRAARAPHVDQDPRQRPRRRRQAVAPEGHRPRPCRLHPLPAVDRRRHRLRPAAAPLHLQGQPQGAPRRAAQRAVGARRARLDRRRSTRSRSSTPSTKQAAEAARRAGVGKGAAADRPDRRARARGAVVPQPRPRVSVLPADAVGVADLIGAADVLASQQALDELTARAKTAPRRRTTTAEGARRRSMDAEPGDHPSRRQREELRARRRRQVHVPRPPGRAQDADPPGRRGSSSTSRCVDVRTSSVKCKPKRRG